MYGTIDDWVRRELLTQAHYIKPSLLTGSMLHGGSQFIDDYSYVMVYTDGSSSGSANNLLGKSVQGAFSNINTGAATVVASSPIRVNPAGTAVAFKDSSGNLRTINLDGTSLTTVIATVLGQICDWKSTKILYVDSSNVIKYVDENGTGNTTVISKFGATIKGARFDATLTRIYYAVDSEIRSVLLNGTGDQIESYVGDFTIIDTYGTTEIVYKENIQIPLAGTTTYTTPVYKKATITDIKNTSQEFKFPIDFRDVLNKTKSTNPMRGGTSFIPFNIPSYAPMRNYWRPNSALTEYYSGVLIDDISPNLKNILGTTRNGDIYLGANRNQGYNSTGRVARLNNWEGTSPDFQKIGSMYLNLSGGVHSIDIPDTFSHLMIEGAIATTISGTMLLRYNDDSTSTNYMSFRVQNIGVQAKQEYLSETGAVFGVSATTLTPFRIFILNYRGGHIKSSISRYASTAAGGVQRVVGVWNNVAAITKLTAVLAGGIPSATSVFHVYGLNGQGRFW